MKCNNVVNFRFGIFLLSVAIFLSACTPIQLVSDYDENIDKGAAALHKKIDTYFVSFGSMSLDERKYKNQQKFYEGVVVDLNSLKVRASAIYKNEITEEQLDVVEENLAYLLLLHKGCVTSKLTTEQKKNIKNNGIDTSVDCKKSHGASSDSNGHGDKVMNAVLVKPIKSMFDQKFAAIMALELAKKRGEE